jgi:hypothetical protein
VLQSSENGNHLVTAVEVQPYVQDGSAIASPLTIKGFSHRICSSKISAGFLPTPICLTKPAQIRSHLREVFSKKTATKTMRKAFDDNH